MSAQSEVNRLRKEAEELMRKIASESDAVARGRERAAKVEQQTAKTSSASTSSRKRQEAARHMKKANDAERKRGDLQGRLASKQKALHQAEARLEKERAKEQDRALKRLEQEARQRETQFRPPLSAPNGVPSVRARTHAMATNSKHDVFISHASEDKEEVARPLAELLINRGVDVWYDDFSLSVGDSLRRSIDQGLASSRFGVVILSMDFFSKEWPQTELDGLAAKEHSTGSKVVLPIWHRVTKDDVLQRSPTLADKRALNTGVMTLEEIADQIATVVNDAELMSSHLQ